MVAVRTDQPQLANNNGKDKSLESWIWDAACSIRGAKDAPKYKDYILPLIFTKRLCDVFDDELNRIAAEVGSRRKAFQLARADHKLVRFYLPLVPDDPEQPVWSVIRKLSDKIGEGVTTHMRAIARENPPTSTTALPIIGSHSRVMAGPPARSPSTAACASSHNPASSGYERLG